MPENSQPAPDLQPANTGETSNLVQPGNDKISTTATAGAAIAVEGKRGRIEGGALTDEALDSSRRVLAANRGQSNNLVGLQQWFTPPEAAKLIAAVFGEPVAVLDSTAGSGALLAPYTEDKRFGIEIDRDYLGGELGNSYTAIGGDAQKVVPMLRATGTKFPAIALNPPFGLTWRDTAHAKGQTGSAALAYLWALDLLHPFGQGAFICGRDRLAKEVLGRPQAKGIYAVVDVEGPLFDGVALPTSIAFFVAPDNLRRDRNLARGHESDRGNITHPTNGSELLSNGFERFSAYRADLESLASDIRDAQRRAARYVSPGATLDMTELRKNFETVGAEYTRRAKEAAATDNNSNSEQDRYDVDLRNGRISVRLRAYNKLVLARKGRLREIELLSGQSPAYFGQNQRSYRQLRELSDEDLLTISPTLGRKVDSDQEEVERQRTPLFPVAGQMRLGWLTSLDWITCKKDDPGYGFVRGEQYRLYTKSKVHEETEHRAVENRHGEPDIRQFKTQRKLLEVRIGEHTFDEGPQNIAYISEHFELPDPGCVASRHPAEVARNRRILEEMEEEFGFELKSFQKDHLSRLLVKGRGMLAHEQGLGKCTSGDTNVFINGALVQAAQIWERYAASDQRYDGEGYWTEPTEPLLTTALNADGRMVQASISRLYRQEVAEWGRCVTLDDGSTITITNAHKLHDADGWTKDVHPGDRVAVPRQVAWDGEPEDLQLTELLAWQIAEGWEHPEQGRVMITQADRTRLEHLRQLARTVGQRYGLNMHSLPITQPDGKSCPHFSIHSKGYRDWLTRDLNYEWGRKSANKRIPDRIVAADETANRTFLRAFLAAEGSVNSSMRVVEVASASRELMDQVALMLRRFGVWLRISEKRKSATNGSGTLRTYYTGLIGGESLRTFADRVGIDDTEKGDKLARVAAKKANTNVGGLPVADVLQEARRGTALPWLHLTTSRAYAFNSGGASPDAARRIAAKLRAAASEGAGQRWRGPKGQPAYPRTLDAYENLNRGALLSLAEKLDERANREVYYARVVSVEPVWLEGYVYDLEVPEHHNYVAGGLLAHNSVMQMCLAEAQARLGAKHQALFVSPQDLLPQWKKEARKFFSRDLEEIRTPAQARDVARRVRAGERGWWITYYEALSVIGRKKELLPEQVLDHRVALAHRLREYKVEKRRAEGRDPREVSLSSIERTLGVGFMGATTKDACPSCQADTSQGWDSESCTQCHYVHRSVHRKTAVSHLSAAFKHGVVCVDEVSEIRGDDSLRSKAVRALARGPHKYGATGTPLSNFVNDSFWAIWFSLGNSSVAFPYDYEGGKARFEADFCVIEHMMGRVEDGQGNVRQRRKVLPQITNVSQFWRLAQPGISRCRKEQTGESLVERTYYPIRVPMGIAQRKAHDFWLDNFAEFFEWKFPEHQLVEQGLVEKFAAALGQLWRLETAATLPASDGPSKEYPVAREKLTDLSNFTPANLKVLELAKEHAENGEKVLIGSDLIMTGKWLAEQLCAKGIKAVHITEDKADGAIGTKNPRKRAREIQDFSSGDAQVLCTGVNALKLGHNLEIASTVLVSGLPYSWMILDQFIARVHRLTSKKPVSVYVVMPKGSLAERKWSLLRDKGGTSDLAFDGELKVQPEKVIDWQKVLKEMKDRGIGSENGSAAGELVDEAAVQEAWEKVPAALPSLGRTPTLEEAANIAARNGAGGGSKTVLPARHYIENPERYTQPALF